MKLLITACLSLVTCVAQPFNGKLPSCLSPVTNGGLTIQCLYVPTAWFYAQHLGGSPDHDLFEVFIISTDQEARAFHVTARFVLDDRHIQIIRSATIDAEKIDGSQQGSVVFKIPPGANYTFSSLVVDELKASATVIVKE